VVDAVYEGYGVSALDYYPLTLVVVTGERGERLTLASWQFVHLNGRLASELLDHLIGLTARHTAPVLASYLGAHLVHLRVLKIERQAQGSYHAVIDFVVNGTWIVFDVLKGHKSS
jgi:hypothetical protein